MKRLPPLRTYSPPSSRAVRAHRGRVGARARLGERVRGEPLARSRAAAGSAASARPCRRASARASRAPARRGSARSSRRPSRPPRSRRASSARRCPCRRTPRRRGSPKQLVLADRARRRPTGTPPTCRSRRPAARSARARASRTRSRISRCSSVSGSSGTPAKPSPRLSADGLDVVAVRLSAIRGRVGSKAWKSGRSPGGALSSRTASASRRDAVRARARRRRRGGNVKQLTAGAARDMVLARHGRADETPSA